MAHNGFDVEFTPLDITSDRSIRAAIDELRERGERLDLLINNAGVLPDAPIGADPERSSVLHTDRRCLREALEANTLGPLMLIQAALPILNKGARIINLSSGMGQLTEMGGHYPAYRLSKCALNAVTRIYAAELGDRGITVNSVCPGWVRTDMGGPSAQRDVAEGVETTLWLATMENPPSGGFFRDKAAIPW